MIEARINVQLDTVLQNRTRIFYGVQNDTGARFINAKIAVMGNALKITGGIPSINFRRQDGESASYEGSVNADGSVKVPVTKWALDVPGEVTCSVSVKSGEKKLTTTEFFIMAQAEVNGSGGSGDEPGGGGEVVYVGIAEIKQTTESTESEGENVWTVTLTNGETEEFIVRNGKQGAQGPQGPAYTLTSADKTHIASMVKTDITTADIQGAADTAYTVLKARAQSLNATEINPTLNGTIAWTYE